jgi:PAS domain S-box-containing protein
LLYVGHIIPVALPTAVCFWLLSIALVIITKFKFKPFIFLSSNSIEDKLIRAFIPLTLFLILLTGYFNTSVFVEFENPLFLAASAMVIILPIFGLIVMSVAKNIGKSLDTANNIIVETEPRFNKAISDSAFPIMIHSEGDVIQLSNSWTKISGYTIEDIPTIAEWTKKAYGDRSELSQEFIHNLYELDSVKDDGEWEIITSDGSKRIWDFKSTPLGRFPDGRRISNYRCFFLNSWIYDDCVICYSYKSGERRHFKKSEV